jgi:hypothetical protein
MIAFHPFDTAENALENMNAITGNTIIITTIIIIIINLIIII